MRAISSRRSALSSSGSCATLARYRSKMSLRSSFVGVRNQTWRPMRPGRVRAGSRFSKGTFVAPRNDVHGVEERVDLVRQEAAHERRVVDAVHRHEQLVERELALAAAAE